MFLASFMLRLLFDLEDGGSKFLRNVCGLVIQLHCFEPKAQVLYTQESLYDCLHRRGTVL
jgi:hypothetical protein